MFPRAFIPMLAGGAALLVAACGSSSTSSSSAQPAAAVSSSSTSSSTPQPTLSSSSSSSSAAAPAGVTVGSTTTSLGTFLVDQNGMTLYLFEKDTTSQSQCDGQCANAWPPLLTAGAPAAGNGVMASLLGTTTRSDGKLQVTYKGHPLYGFIADKKPGDLNGEGVTAFGAKWYVLGASTGDKIDKD